MTKQGKIGGKYKRYSTKEKVKLKKIFDRINKKLGGKWYKVSYYGIIYYTNKKPYFPNNFSRTIEKQRY